jgi:GNAT superfamily N-acetyltransferase
MNIIRGTPEHASRLTEITMAAKRHWNYPGKWMQLWLPQLTISPEYISENEVWMAAEDDKVIAYYSLKLQPVIARSRKAATKQSPSIIQGLLRREEHPPRNDGNDLWLDNLWVLPEHIGHGIGKQLFQHALEQGRTQNVSILKIEADPNAQSFYERMGARKVGESHYPEMDGQPRILPILEINL